MKSIHLGLAIPVPGLVVSRTWLGHSDLTHCVILGLSQSLTAFFSSCQMGITVPPIAVKSLEIHG